ncbi:olfactory receptor 5V1-like [Chrysemys picta bellii]|uniref:olfactory receptor 5V1-like n=1 Tax=Chrysemys picta bellii TaxID=8478 RepID=UPI0032B10FC6
MAKLLPWNEMLVTEFILLGFSESHEIQCLLFALFLLFYLVALAGNILLLITLAAEWSLHTPMYFFLGKLYFLEICYTTNIFPCMLASFLSEAKSISFNGCMAQFYLFGSLGVTECLLLSVMSYDRYLAICHPLSYASVMNFKVCLQLAAGCWITGFLTPIAMMVLTFTLPFCASKEVGHFFCDFMPLLKLSCTDTHLVEFLSFTVSACVTLVPFLLTLTSYYRIILTIRRIPSTTGKKKAFSTCSSHLLVVSIFYGTIIIVYGAPVGNQSPALNKAFSLLYTVISPMFNPLIYSLRNKEVKGALRKVGSKVFTFLKKSNIP